jgi:hypothetical protein
VYETSKISLRQLGVQGIKSDASLNIERVNNIAQRFAHLATIAVSDQ